MTIRRDGLPRARRASHWLAAGVAAVVALSWRIAPAALPPGHPSVAASSTPPSYPVTDKLQDAPIAMLGLVYLELADDALSVSVFFQVHNLGLVTWRPSNVVIDLPHDYGSFQTETDESRPGFEELVGRGAVFRGLFPPGQHDTQFRFGIPYSTDGPLSFSMTLPPRVGRLRIVADAAAGMQLSVPGFAEPAFERDRSGRRVLSTERELAPGDSPLERLTITLDHLPGAMLGGSWLAVAAIAIMISGVVLAYRIRRGPREAKDIVHAKSRLVGEIAALDDAHAKGLIGTAGYDRLRRLLLDALGQILARTGS
jgi:hypothetical protein